MGKLLKKKKIMSIQQRQYLHELEYQAWRRGYTKEELEAQALRKEFFNDYIVNFDTNLYRTQVERDWAFIAKREYNYDVLLNSIMAAGFFANVATTFAIFMT